MALNPKQLAEAKKVLDQINSAYTSLGKQNPFADFDLKGAKDFNATMKQLEDILKGANSQLQSIDDALSGIVGSFRATVQEISKSNVGLRDSKKIFTSLGDLGAKLRDDQSGLAELSVKELKSIKQKLEQRKVELKDNDAVLRQRKEELIAENKLGTTSLTQKKKNRDEILKINNAIAAGSAEMEGESGLSDDLIAKAQKRLEEEEKLNEAIGIGGNLLGGISTALDKLGMGGLSEKLGFDDASKKMRNVAKEITNGGKESADLGDKFEIAFAGLGSIKDSLLKNLKDPMVLISFAISGIIKVFGALVNLTSGLDKSSGELAKNMNMTYSEAVQLNDQLAEVSSVHLRDSLVSSQGLGESLMEINKTLGTNVMLNQEDLVTFTKLREAAGFTNEELMGIQQLTLANGQSLKENTGEFLAQAKTSAMQNGVLLNEKELLKGISEVSAATTISFGKNPALIADAVASAKALGMELDQVEAIADSLLDFEGSIANELEAELLLGKDINLEKARQAALDNDLATLAKEISSQVGSSAEFAEMNRIQQDALAKSLGMSREDIAQTLFTQEQLAGATGEEAERRQKILDQRIAEVGLAQAQKEIAKDGLKNLESQASVSERLEKTVKKIKDTFMGFAAVILEVVSPLVDIILPVFNGISAAVKLVFEGLSTILPLIKGLGIALAIMNIPLMINAVLSIFRGAFLALKNPLIAIPAALAGIALMKRAMKADDMVSLGDNQAGYGKRTLMAPEGAIALNNKDTIIAGTNLFGRANDMVSSPEGSINVGSDMNKTNALLATLVTQNNKKPQISPVGLYSVQ